MMRKYESIEYIRQLGLPTVWCKEFTYSQKQEMEEYFDDHLKRYGKVGVRTDYGYEHDHSIIYNYPIFLNKSKDVVFEFINKYKNKYTYIVSEFFYMNEIIINGTVNVSPGLNLFIAYNDLPEVPSCRHAIEDPRYAHGVKYLSIPLPQTYPIPEWAGIVRHYIKKAWLRDEEVIGKRFEFNITSDYKRVIFWQISEDKLILNNF